MKKNKIIIGGFYAKFTRNDLNRFKAISKNI